MRRLATSSTSSACRITGVAAALRALHFRETNTPHPLGNERKPKVFQGEWENPIHHEVWTKEECDNITFTHEQPNDAVDRVAYLGVKTVRFLFDLISGYKFGPITPPKIMRRVLFLETIAGVPGMVAGSLRHLRSLRRMERDHGWIHTLLEEAENERMHMLTFMDVYRPGMFFRLCVLGAQGIVWNVFFLCYLVSPRLCHRFVGYLEEEAVRTYTTILQHMDSTDPADAETRKFGQQPANDIAKQYWKLPETATMRDVMNVIRMDESNHRDVNHNFATMGPDDTNPHAATPRQEPSGYTASPPTAAAH